MSNSLLRGCSEAISQFHKDNEMAYKKSDKGIREAEEEKRRVAENERWGKAFLRNELKLKEMSRRIELKGYKVESLDPRGNSSKGIIGFISVSTQKGERVVFTMCFQNIPNGVKAKQNIIRKFEDIDFSILQDEGN